MSVFWYLIGVVGRCCGYYGEGRGAIHIRQVTCSGSERNITNCTYINNTVITSHAQDVGVECRQGQSYLSMRNAKHLRGERNERKRQATFAHCTGTQMHWHGRLMICIHANRVGIDLANNHAFSLHRRSFTHTINLNIRYIYCKHQHKINIHNKTC